jgi:hypothetical protein
MRVGVRHCLTVLLLLGSCRHEQAGSGKVNAALSAAASSLPTPSAALAEPASKSSDAGLLVRELLSRWLEAQNHADFAAYESLYGKTFVGTKRVGVQAFRFNRARWLIDRKGMFSHALRVSVAQVAIVDLGQTAVLRFEQTFESDKFRDVGQKQLTLARDGARFSIVREEMLTSFQTAPAGVPAFAELAFVEQHAGRSFVLLERSSLPPVRPEFVDLELSVSAIAGENALPEARRGLSGREVILYGEQGELCRVKAKRLVLAARAVPHEGQTQVWSGKSEEQPAPPKSVIARELFELAGSDGRNLALELETAPGCNGAFYARAADQPSLEVLTRRAPSAAERTAALAAFKALPLYAKNQEAFERDGNHGDWASFEDAKPEMFVFTGRAGDWLSVSLEVGHGCAEYRGEGFALFRLQPGGKLELASDGGNGNWFVPRAVVDANGDGAPELLGFDLRLFQRVSGTFAQALDLSPPIFACGC